MTTTDVFAPITAMTLKNDRSEAQVATFDPVYMGTTPVEVGQNVEVLLLDKWEPVMVQSALASQFTYKTVEGGKFGFHDYNSTEWRKI